MISTIKRKLVGRSIGDIIALFWTNLSYLLKYYTPSNIRARRRDKKFDARFGTHTSGSVEFANLDVPEEKIRTGVRYQPTGNGVLDEFFERIDLPIEDYTFIDFGSGKGRVLLFASNWAFKEIIGVEISHMLHDIAAENIRIYKNPDQKCFNIRSECIDVCDFNPPQTPLICYFYNPFYEEVFRKVIEKIQKTYNENKRPIWVFYNDPTNKHVFHESEKWSVIFETPDIGIYKISES